MCQRGLTYIHWFLVGDIAPREGIPKAEKHRLESEAMHNFVHDMLHDSPAAQKINSLWAVSTTSL